MRCGWSTGSVRAAGLCGIGLRAGMEQRWVTISLSDVKILFEGQVSLMNGQLVSAGLRSGDLGGSGNRVKFSGILRCLVVCQPCWFRTRTAWASGARIAAISSRRARSAAVSASGFTGPAPTLRRQRAKGRWRQRCRPICCVGCTGAGTALCHPLSREGSGNRALLADPRVRHSP